jgi:hypothetical protein
MTLYRPVARSSSVVVTLLVIACSLRVGSSSGFDVCPFRLAAWKHRQRGHTIREDGQPSPQVVYAAMMTSTFTPALRAAGLRGYGGRLELPSDTYWAQLGFQTSSYSGADELRFTVNLSVINRAE